MSFEARGKAGKYSNLKAGGGRRRLHLPSAYFLLVALFASLTCPFGALPAIAAQRGRALVAGEVKDEAGAAIPAANVSLVTASGEAFDAQTDAQGRFAIRDLAPGEYTLRVLAEGFAEHSEPATVAAGERRAVDVTLSIAAVEESITVASDVGLNADPASNASAIVITGRDLEALPDDPDELASVLQEMAGPGAGPGGGQFYVDGFQGGRLPPKESIREVRINANPFSAEFDRLGFGRIEILTKPGSDRFRGTLFGAFTDESLNARNAFALERAPQQERRYGGNVSGPLGKRASYFFDFERREFDENETVSATILNDALEAVPFTTTVLTPRRRTEFAPRFDFQLSENHTLVVRYELEEATDMARGVGGYSLPSRAVDFTEREQTLSITETWIINPQVISETRLQLERERRTSQSVEDAVGVTVLDAFSAGSPAGLTEQGEDELELYQNFTFSYGAHALKAGGKLRIIRLNDLSTSNFAGTYTFAGDVERDPVTGEPLGGIENAVAITSLEQYRRTLLGLPGYQPSQFTLIAGDPFASVVQYEVGGFVQDDWRVRPELTVSLGLRYENQTNIDDNLNFAPRAGFAYAFNGADGRPTTVIRGGIGVFYDRFGEDLVLDAARLNGTSQIQYFVSRPEFFPLVPTPSQLAASAVPGTIRTIDAGLNTPYTIEGAIGVERQLPWDLTTSVNWVWARGVHQLRTRNLNAPLPGSGVRPLGEDVGNVFVYEASGLSRRQQLRFSVNRRGGGPFTFFSNYTLGWANSDTDSAGSLPSNPFDLSADYGRSSFDVRHHFVAGGSVDLPWNVRLSPFVIARSARPYNITSGGDLNGDTAFLDRPSFALPGETGAIETPLGSFDPTPEPGDEILPRNFADGPGFVMVNLQASRTFSFGGSRDARFDPSTARQSQPGGFGGMGGRRGGFGGGRGGFGGPGGGSSDQRFGLTVSVRASNILNRVNYASPSGVLTSPNFGQYNVALPGRRIEGQLRFTF
jgi:hypothetical protein